MIFSLRSLCYIESENRWKREMDLFIADCLKLLESLTSKFVEKLPLKYAVVKNAKSLNLEIMCMTLEKGMKLFLKEFTW